MKGLVFIVFSFLSISSLGQEVEILKKSTSAKSINDTRFEFLRENINPKSLVFVGTLRATGKDKKASLSKLYFKLKDQAYVMGANSFKMANYTKNEIRKEASLTVDVFKANDSVLNNSKATRERNVIYVFLNDFTENESYIFTISGSDKEIESGTYYRYQLKQGESATIDSGGLLSSSFTLKWKKDNPSSFITLTDFGQEDPSKDYEYSGRFFNTKRINFMESSLGWLLIELMKPMK
jgi:hypothetical protein